MKLTTGRLRNLIKEETNRVLSEVFGKDDEITEAIDDISDAIQMLESEDDSSGTLFHVINRLYEALERLQRLALAEKNKENA